MKYIIDKDELASSLNLELDYLKIMGLELDYFIYEWGNILNKPKVLEMLRNNRNLKSKEKEILIYCEMAASEIYESNYLYRYEINLNYDSFIPLIYEVIELIFIKLNPIILKFNLKSNESWVISTITKNLIIMEIIYE